LIPGIAHWESAFRDQLSAISFQLSAVSYQLSEISFQKSAFSHQQSAFSRQETISKGWLSPVNIELRVARSGSSKADPNSIAID
jgi:hypothetical protein